jgi:hypothetical protein
LATAQTDKEKVYIKDKMRQDSELSKILRQIETGESVDDSSGNTIMSARDSSKSGALGIQNVAGQVTNEYTTRLEIVY